MKTRPHVAYEYCYCLNIYFISTIIYIYIIYISVFKTKIANDT